MKQVRNHTLITTYWSSAIINEMLAVRKNIPDISSSGEDLVSRAFIDIQPDEDFDSYFSRVKQAHKETYGQLTSVREDHGVETYSFILLPETSIIQKIEITNNDLFSLRYLLTPNNAQTSISFTDKHEQIGASLINEIKQQNTHIEHFVNNYYLDLM